MREPALRRFPVGAEVCSETETHFRVWAPASEKVEVVFFMEKKEARSVPLEPEDKGYFSIVEVCPEGSLYAFRLNGRPEWYPDPASRYQPEGPHGPSQVVNSSAYTWRDTDWPGAKLEDQIIYEMHIGTFTSAGTYVAASEQLPELKDLGITMIELMPLAEFPGRFGWGYDGVDLFAPTRLYGVPNELRSFVDSAHQLGIAVILDVVYNHVGPDGNYLKSFTPDYFSKIHKSEWGEALNYDGPNSGPVREFFISNAVYWITEFHFDGLRLDAVPNIFDDSAEHICTELTRECRKAAGKKNISIIAEDESQRSFRIRPVQEGGCGLDGVWNDDFHHSAMVLLTGRNQAYYTDYLGKPQEFISALKWGFLYQGQRYKWQNKRRGTPTFGIQPSRFVTFIQNHDQIANSSRGLRVHLLTDPGNFRAMTALLLLGPNTPMLFQGQEFASSKPFLYFADHKAELATLVREGRADFLKQFHSIATLEGKALLSDPSNPETFQACKLDLKDREKNSGIYQMHKDLIRLRKAHSLNFKKFDGAVLGENAFLIRFFDESSLDFLLVLNFGIDLHLDPAPEPLLAPPLEHRWSVLWSSENPGYGGNGTPALDTPENWWIPGHAAVLLHPKRIGESK